MDPATNGTPLLPLYTAISRPLEEKSALLEHAEASSLVALPRDADDIRSKKKSKILILDRLCRNLATFKSTKELLTVFADAAEAHQQALDKANILHRDISVGNIFITGKGRGVFLDWDVSKPVNDTGKCAGKTERIGTFRFLSARFVDSEKFDFGPHDRLDDLESFFHALQWVVLRFGNHRMSPVDLGYTIFTAYDSGFFPGDGLVWCSRRSRTVRVSVWSFGLYEELFKGVLPDLLEDVRKAVDSRYKDTGWPLAAYEYYLNQIELGTPESHTAAVAKPAILYLMDPNWFRDQLREAAENPQCPNNDPSTPHTPVYPPRRCS